MKLAEAMTLGIILGIHLVVFLVLTAIGRQMHLAWLAQDLENLHHPENHSSRRAALQIAALGLVLLFQFGLIVNMVYILSIGGAQ